MQRACIVVIPNVLFDVRRLYSTTVYGPNVTAILNILNFSAERLERNDVNIRYNTTFLHEQTLVCNGQVDHLCSLQKEYRLLFVGPSQLFGRSDSQ